MIALLVACPVGNELCYNTSMKIHLRYFASVRETIGQDEEVLTVHEGTRVADVRALLLARYPQLQPIIERSAFAVNHSYVPVYTALQEGDEVVFIPPVGGGTLPDQELRVWSQ